LAEAVRKVLAFGTADDVADAAAFLFVNLAHQAVAERGRFFVSFAGGTTPLACYRLLAAPLIAT
jgi:6-phosphogluconolactonase/glucosamine-6-phosphate isomerase/deaminase